MKAIAILAGLGLLGFVVACGGGSLESSEAVATNEVAVKDNKFEARVIEVPAGSEVTWTWEADRSHNVTGDGWASGDQEEGTFVKTLTSPGTFDYRCTLHGGMTGRVIVSQ
jgi:plastocyanin